MRTLNGWWMWYARPLWRSWASKASGLQAGRWLSLRMAWAISMVRALKDNVHAVVGNLDAVSREFGPFVALFHQHGVGVVDVDEDLADVGGQAVELFDHAAGPALWQGGQGGGGPAVRGPGPPFGGGPGG